MKRFHRSLILPAMVWLATACSADDPVDPGPAVCTETSTSAEPPVALTASLFTLADTTALTAQDRQKLVQIRARPTTASLQLVRLHDEAGALLQAPSGRLGIAVSPNRTFAATRVQAGYNSTGEYSWLGGLFGQSGNAHVLLLGEYATATIASVAADSRVTVYEIEHLRDRLHVAICADRSKGN